jgi:hypothetical protein
MLRLALLTGRRILAGAKPPLTGQPSLGTCDDASVGKVRFRRQDVRQSRRPGAHRAAHAGAGTHSGKTYRGMAEFEAWQPYRAAVKVCNETNENYIALREPPSAFNYPAALQHLLDHGWRAAQRPAGARRAGAATIGGQRAGAVLRKPAADPVSPLRRGLGRAPVNNWDHIKLFEQVNAVAFRGDTRPPEVIFAATDFTRRRRASTRATAARSRKRSTRSCCAAGRSRTSTPT